MSRAVLDYAAGGATPSGFAGFDPDEPIAGFYRTRQRKGAPLSAVKIWHGLPPDPVTGELLDRSPRWQATLNGAPVDLERVWPSCGRDPIDEETHDRMIEQFKTLDEESAFYDARRPVDRLTVAPPF